MFNSSLFTQCYKNNKKLVILHNKAEKSTKYQTDSSYHTELEIKIFNEIAEYLDKLIALVDPQFIYMAIDGEAAPVPKWNNSVSGGLGQSRLKNLKIKCIKNTVLIMKHLIPIVLHRVQFSCINLCVFP